MLVFFHVNDEAVGWNIIDLDWNTSRMPVKKEKGTYFCQPMNKSMQEHLPSPLKIWTAGHIQREAWTSGSNI